jgi:hypothetical protein
MMNLIVGKLNFTGKHFAPDSIFINNIGKNLGDDDDGRELDNLLEPTLDDNNNNIKNQS